MRSNRPFLKPLQKKHAQKRRRYYAWWAAGIIFAVFAIIALAAWGSHHERVTIQDIQVTGNEAVQTEDIERTARSQMEGSYWYVFNKQNIFLYPKQRIHTALRNAFPRIRQVDIAFETLTSITIDVREREGAYLWCGAEVPAEEPDVLDSCYFMDNTGFIFAKAPSFSDNVFFEWFGKPRDEHVADGAQFIPEQAFTRLVSFIDGVRGTEFEPTRLSVGTSSPRYTLHVLSGSRILFDSTENVERLLDTLGSALPELDREKELSYIDLRFGNKVFYKYEEE